MKYKCLIVDDERPALNLLEAYVAKLPHLELVDRCERATDALAVLKSEKIDILFLDIQMPDLTGLELLGALKVKPVVVLTTAYRDYAIEGFKHEAIDYVIKPFSFERFVQAVNRATERLDLIRKADAPKMKVATSSEPVNSILDDPFFVRTTHKLEKISLRDVLYLESMREYVGIFTAEKRYVIHASMNSMEDKLPVEHFIRVHRSYIVAFDQIDAINGNTIYVGEKSIPVGGNYRKAFFERVELL